MEIDFHKPKKTKKCRGTKQHGCSTLIESRFQLCKKCRYENDRIARKINHDEFLKDNPDYYKKYRKNYKPKKIEVETLKPANYAKGGISKMMELRLTPGEVRKKLNELGAI